MAEREITEELILSIRANYAQAIEGIAKYNQKIDELKEKQRQLKADLRDGAIAEHEYQKAMAASKEEMKVYKEGARILGKEIQNNVRHEKEQKDSLVALRSQLSNLTRQYDLLSKAEREGAAGKELQKKINAITTEIKGAEAETQRFYRNVGNYEGAIRNALGLNGNFANSIMSLKDLGGGSIMQGATTSVRAFGASLTALLANPAFLALAGIVGTGAAFKWFYDYNKGIAEATRLTKEFTGLTGDALEDVRNSIQATADTFGKDYLETLRAVDGLMAQYHLSASDAIKVINDGFVAGADLSGDFLSQIQQYAPSFHDAGIAADEMVAIIAQTRSGIFSEGGLNLIQMANNRIRTMSQGTQTALDNIGMSAQQVEKDLQSGAKSTFDVLQEISARLKDLPQDGQAVGDVLKNVFGKTAANEGLQMIESLATMTTKIEDVKKVTGEYGEMQEEQIAANKELNDVMSALFDQSQNGFETMIGHVKILATKWLVSVIKRAIGFANALIDVYNESMLVRGALQLIILNLKGVWDTAKLVFNLIIDAIKPVARALRGVAYLLEGVATLSWDKVKTGFLDVLTAVPKGIAEMGKDIGKWGGNAADAFADGWNNTIHNKPLRHIEVATGAGDMESDVPESVGATGKGGTKEAAKAAKSAAEKAAKERARAAEKAAKAAADAMKKESEEVKKAEDLMLQLVEKSYEQQRQAVAQSYDHKIADVRTKLATEKNLTAAAIKAMNDQIVMLERLKQRDLQKLSDEQLKKRVEQSNKEIQMYLETVRKGSLEEYNLRQQQLQNNRDVELAEAQRAATDEESRQSMIAAIKAKYAQQQKMLNDELSRAEEDAIKRRWNLRMAEAKVDENDPYPELTQLRLELQMRKEMLDNAHQLETETDEEFLQRKLQMQSEYNEQQRALANKEVDIATAKADAIGQTIGALGDLAEEFAEQDKSLAQLSKVLALAEIAINTGVAIAEGVKQAQAVPYPGNLVAIATTVATVLANVAAATKMVKAAKFAKGGKVEGEGTETSDSVPAMLSDGESVMTAKATRMFAPMLSVMNQLGGGVPIPGGGGEMGMDYMTKAVEDGVRKMPRPVVSVEEITKVSNRVEVIESLREL
jgi:FtsZ-binding cell division protein ZapB